MANNCRVLLNCIPLLCIHKVILISPLGRCCTDYGGNQVWEPVVKITVLEKSSASAQLLHQTKRLLQQSSDEEISLASQRPGEDLLELSRAAVKGCHWYLVLCHCIPSFCLKRPVWPLVYRVFILHA